MGYEVFSTREQRHEDARILARRILDDLAKDPQQPIQVLCKKWGRSNPVIYGIINAQGAYKYLLTDPTRKQVAAARAATVNQRKSTASRVGKAAKAANHYQPVVSAARIAEVEATPITPEEHEQEPTPYLTRLTDWELYPGQPAIEEPAPYLPDLEGQAARLQSKPDYSHLGEEVGAALDKLKDPAAPVLNLSQVAKNAADGLTQVFGIVPPMGVEDEQGLTGELSEDLATFDTGPLTKDEEEQLETSFRQEDWQGPVPAVDPHLLHAVQELVALVGAGNLGLMPIVDRNTFLGDASYHMSEINVYLGRAQRHIDLLMSRIQKLDTGNEPA